MQLGLNHLSYNALFYNALWSKYQISTEKVCALQKKTQNLLQCSFMYRLIFACYPGRVDPNAKNQGSNRRVPASKQVNGQTLPNVQSPSFAVSLVLMTCLTLLKHNDEPLATQRRHQ